LRGRVRKEEDEGWNKVAGSRLSYKKSSFQDTQNKKPESQTRDKFSLLIASKFTPGKRRVKP